MQIDDEEAFLDRLGTFRVETWFAKPDALTPAVCASFGWSNTAPDRLECGSCKATLEYSRTEEDILKEDATEKVETFLQNLEWEHDADCIWCEERCPESFLTLDTRPGNANAYANLLTRFTRLSVLWDLPKLEMKELSSPEIRNEIETLREKLQRDWRRNTTDAAVSVDFQSEVWKTRTHTLTVLALLGWEMLVLDYPVGKGGEAKECMDLVQKGMIQRPEEIGCCLARQTVLRCKHCAASIGLWSHESAGDVTLEAFRDFSKGWMGHSPHVVVDAEAGEVEDLFKRMYDDKELTKISSTPSTGSENMSSQRNKQETSLKRALSLELERSGSQPPFGLHRLKKQKVEAPAAPASSALVFLDGPVKENQLLNPIEEHRYFCTYRKQWRDLLATSARIDP